MARAILLLALALSAQAHPRRLRGLEKTVIAGIDTGCRHTLAWGEDGTLFAAGDASSGQLETGSLGIGGDFSLFMPVATRVKYAAAGCENSYWLTRDGKVWATGLNENGQLCRPRGKTSSGCELCSTSEPLMVDIGDVTKIVAGKNSVFFLKTDGTVWACGLGGFDFRGDGKNGNAYAPTQVPVADVRDISVGGYTAFFVTLNGTVWGTGRNTYGNLGDGTQDRKPFPVQVMTDVEQVANSRDFTFFLKTDGHVWAAGYNEWGEFGNGQSNTLHPQPVQIQGNMSSVSVQKFFSLFLKADGSVWSSGINAFGRLGCGDSCDNRRGEMSPVLANGVHAVSAGDQHSVFLLSDGSVWTAGRNSDGRLGDGTKTSRYTPVPAVFAVSWDTTITTTATTATATTVTMTATFATATTVTTTTLTWSPLATAKTLQPIFGSDRACRGKNKNDNQASNYEVMQGVTDLDECKQLCFARDDCTGIEYSGQSCEIWTAPIQSSRSLAGFTCLVISPAVLDFQAVDGGSDRACRGTEHLDHPDGHYHIAEVNSFEDCLERCRHAADCRGVQHIEGSCQVWTVAITSTVANLGASCFSYAFAPQWRSADGGVNRACRGFHSSDNRASYFLLSDQTQSLGACQADCEKHPSCIGIEFSRGRCELWTRSDGLGATVALEGFTCLRYDRTQTVKTPSTLGPVCPIGWELTHLRGPAWGNGGETDCTTHPDSYVPWGTVKSCQALGSGFIEDFRDGYDRGCAWAEYVYCKRCLWTGPVQRV